MRAIITDHLNMGKTYFASFKTDLAAMHARTFLDTQPNCNGLSWIEYNTLTESWLLASNRDDSKGLYSRLRSAGLA